MSSRLIVGITVAVALAVSPAASAAAPLAGTYKGTISYHKAPVTYNGFNDPVTFSVAPSGSTITGFSFGFFSCSGSGGPLTPGKNYWLGVLKKVPSAALSKTGSFSGSGKWAHSQTAPTLTDTIKYTIHGRFNEAGTTASGTIAINENLTGPSIKTPPSTSNCATYTFTATHG
jgi:hypothetical protein